MSRGGRVILAGYLQAAAKPPAMVRGGDDPVALHQFAHALFLPEFRAGPVCADPPTVFQDGIAGDFDGF